ncbi:carboxypeptidase B-like [Paramacrobiotus metropolitanus]|uniref:carboxypeptidase B-like n=1 Tax=Paramacrobiotus metropolitanus TaxID=2943436 RepID=UPI0024456AC5|nr:carboxypeptidase B-like [Paramacrobiotus metropolitanus]
MVLRNSGIGAVLVFVAVICWTSVEAISYHNYKVFHVIPDSEQEITALQRLLHHLQHTNQAGAESAIQFWDDEFFTGKKHKVTVAPDHVSGFTSFCQLNGLRNELVWDDFSSVLRQHEPETPANRLGMDKALLMNWETYHRYTTITSFYLYLETEHPDIVRRVLLGRTYEGRNMWLLKIGRLNANGTFADPTKPAIWVDSGIHAREWISSATVTFMINQMVTNSSNSWMYEQLNWYILPMINPDGFDYTHTNERLWRKTRRIDPFSECIGVDANRNYDFQWQKVKPAIDPCTNTYGGPAPYSEPENLLIFEQIMDLKRELRAFLTFHSHGQLWMPPYGYTYDHTPDYPDLYALSINATAALRAVYGTVYRVGTSAEILYTSSGTSRDFAKGRTPTKYVFTIELRDTGEFEFLLPADQIIPSGRETMEALKVVARRLIDEFSR